MADIEVPKDKKVVLKEAEEKVNKIEKQYKEGLLSNEEREEHVVETWTEAKDKIGDLVKKQLGKNNSINFIITSRARGSWPNLIR